jgi:hypothetical protein
MISKASLRTSGYSMMRKSASNFSEKSTISARGHNRSAMSSSRRKLKPNSSQQSIRSNKKNKKKNTNGHMRFNSNSGMSHNKNPNVNNERYLKNVRPVEQSFDGVVGQVELQRPGGAEYDPSAQKIDDFMGVEAGKLPRLDGPQGNFKNFAKTTGGFDGYPI